MSSEVVVGQNIVEEKERIFISWRIPFVGASLLYAERDKLYARDLLYLPLPVVLSR